jgi:hypothetical protein
MSYGPYEDGYEPPGAGTHMGRRLIETARQFLGCHYLNGAYGARPMPNDSDDGGGLSNRPGGVVLIADPKRLDPSAVGDPKKAIAVKAAAMTVKEYCVCAGRYLKVGGGREASPSDDDLKKYLSSLAGKDPKSWPNFVDRFTPRRVYGQREGGKLVWGEDCTGVRHFDCITYVNYCMSQVGKLVTNSIDQWSSAPENAAPKPEDKEKAMAKMVWTSSVTGGKVYRLPFGYVKPGDGDILVGLKGVNPQHIAIASREGTIFQAASTGKGVHADDTYDANKWMYLVRNFV